MATKRGKEFPLTISVRAVDRATSSLKRINDRLEKTFKPFRDFSEQAGKLRDNLGLPKIAAGFRGIAGVVKSLTIGFGAMAAAGYGAFRVARGMIDEFDQLGDASEKIGITADALAQLRFAAKKSGVETSELDAALAGFNKSMGLARAKSGQLYGFLGKVSPVLRKQVLQTESSEEAFALMADAMVKVTDPAKRAALATAVFGGAGAELVPLLARGSKGIDELKKRYAELAGPQGDAVKAAGAFGDSMDDAEAATQGLKARIVEGLAPALTQLITRLTKLITQNRATIAAWAREFGEKLPARIEKLWSILRAVGSILGDVARAIGWVTDKLGGAENAVKLLVGGFLAFKGLQLVGHLGQIAQGFVGMGTAATGAMGAIGKLGAAVPILTGVYLAAKAAADALDRAQTKDIDRRVNKGAVQRDLANFDRARWGGKDAGAARRALVRQLREQGLIDLKTGQLKKGAKTRDLFKSSEGWWNPFHDQDEAAQDQVDRVNRILRQGPISGAGITRPVLSPVGPPTPALGPPAPAPQEAHVTVDFKNVPSGARVTTDRRSTADVDVRTGYQMVTP